MNQFHDEMELFAALVEPLTRPNHGYASMLQLCRRIRIGDDLCRRGVAKLVDRFGPLIAVENHRLTLTAQGRRVWEVARQVRALGENGMDGTAILNVECSPFLAEVLLQVLPGFLGVFGGVLGLRICNLDEAAVKQNIAAHRTDFGIGLIPAEDEVHSGMEVLETKVLWVLLMHTGHRFQDGIRPVAGSDLRPDDRIFLPSDAMQVPSLGQWVKGVDAHNRVECDSLTLIRRVAAAGLGLGVTIGLDCVDTIDGLVVRQIAGVEEQRLCLHLPRRAANLSEPAVALLDAIRGYVAMPSRCKPESPEAKKETEDVIEALVEETVTPLEVLS
jgi:DNA-binding transcriptional LysR family regulator